MNRKDLIASVAIILLDQAMDGDNSCRSFGWIERKVSFISVFIFLFVLIFRICYYCFLIKIWFYNDSYFPFQIMSVMEEIIFTFMDDS